LRRFAHVTGSSDEPSPLTPRETEILALIADGEGNAQICERLHLSLGTVKSYIASILAKLAASDRAHAAAIAFRRGLLR
jgi:DNA-binding NarL/FixJ family response regulator